MIVDLRDLDNLRGIAPLFAKLLRNQEFLTTKVNEELGRTRDFQGQNSYSGPVFILEFNNDFMIRANVWTPPVNYGDARLNDNEAFLYPLPHDHNFTFMTGSYYGSGYRTKIYEWDGVNSQVLPGDSIDLEFLEDTCLDKGKIMIYRESRDVHSQLHPEEFSKSLNLMMRGKYGDAKQFHFDCDNKRIVDFARAGVAVREVLCHLAAHVSNDRTIDLQSDIAQNHSDSYLRSSSPDALTTLLPACSQEFESLRRADQDPRVRRGNAPAVY